jgi:hypothetical protein
MWSTLGHMGYIPLCQYNSVTLFRNVSDVLFVSTFQKLKKNKWILIKIKINLMSAYNIWIHELTFRTAVINSECRHSKVESGDLHDKRNLPRLELCTL